MYIRTFTNTHVHIYIHTHTHTHTPNKEILSTPGGGEIGVHEQKCPAGRLSHSEELYSHLVVDSWYERVGQARWVKI